MSTAKIMEDASVAIPVNSAHGDNDGPVENTFSDGPYQIGQNVA